MEKIIYLSMRLKKQTKEEVIVHLNNRFGIKWNNIQERIFLFEEKVNDCIDQIFIFIEPKNKPFFQMHFDNFQSLKKWWNQNVEIIE